MQLITINVLTAILNQRKWRVSDLATFGNILPSFVVHLKSNSSLWIKRNVAIDVFRLYHNNDWQNHKKSSLHRCSAMHIHDSLFSTNLICFFMAHFTGTLDVHRTTSYIALRFKVSDVKLYERQVLYGFSFAFGYLCLFCKRRRSSRNAAITPDCKVFYKYFVITDTGLVSVGKVRQIIKYALR